MCCRRSEGVVYKRCTHYVPISFHDKRDCGNRYCTFSAAHPRSCKNCNCEIHWYPDYKQDTVGYREGACSGCFQYFAGRPVINAQ
ncbi:hypothetical protein EXIGLDRAFT_721193 [Exidia glandulosa HHB12029]|uniref:Uncharacterized protein n=1 Tax=Exidia glandulosa HHB12029 TaxID=1314781 RepID=A0A165FW41_EXIGL|nr:hypothetical protein EXIGLDRAFT_721193 [Exidia glandulosa HHB12029]